MKYILSKKYTLTQEEENTLLLIKITGTTFEINARIFQFISHFKNPISLEEVRSLSDPTGLDESQDKRKEIESFFESLKKRQIIIPYENEVYSPIEIIQKYQPGDSYHEYTINKLITTNGYTEVYEVECEEQSYIMKTTNVGDKIEYREKEKLITDFKSEAFVYTSLKDEMYFTHPVFVSEEDLIFIFPKFEGIGLHKYIYKNRLDHRSKSKLIKQIINAITLLHDNKVIHGDLHYGNILIGDNLEIRIIDFDLSSTQETINANKGGYYPFLAPEQIKNDNFDYHKGLTSYQTDVYQLGVLIYYIVYEKLPFYHAYWDQLSDLILKNSPDWPKVFHLESEINLCKECLYKNLKIRPDSASIIGN